MWNVVADAGQHATLVMSDEVESVRVRGWRRINAIVRPAQGDCRHANCGLPCKFTLDCLQCRIAKSVAIAVAIRMDDDIDEIWIVERRCRSGIGRLVELPSGRP